MHGWGSVRGWTQCVGEAQCVGGLSAWVRLSAWEMTATATSESLPPLLLPLVLYRISTSGEERTLHSTSRRLPVHVGWVAAWSPFSAR